MSAAFALKPFRRQHAKQAIQLMVNSFSKYDPLSKSGIVSPESWRQRFQKIVPKFLQVEQLDSKKRSFSTVYKTDSEIVAILIAIKFKQSLKMANQDMLLLQPLLKFPFSQNQLQNSVYAEGFSVDQNYLNQKIGSKFFLDASQHFWSIGIKYGFGVVYNPISAKVYKKVGSQVIYEGTLQKIGSSMPYVIFRTDFEKAKNLKFDQL